MLWSFDTCQIRLSADQYYVTAVNIDVRDYLGVKTCEVFLCSVAIVRGRVYYFHFFVLFVLRHWWVSKVFTPRKSPISANQIREFSSSSPFEIEPYNYLR